MKKLTAADKQSLSKEFSIPLKSIETVIAIESGGIGFSNIPPYKIIIQFEPSWFKRKTSYTPSGLWSLNKVEKQEKEWLAFNDAFRLNKEAAMESTSVGLMQVMGFHYKMLGFKTVGDMWDYAKLGEYEQLRLGILFIKSNTKMFNAFKDFSKMANCRTFAYYYNGELYEKYNYHNKLYNFNQAIK